MKDLLLIYVNIGFCFKLYLITKITIGLVEGPGVLDAVNLWRLSGHILSGANDRESPFNGTVKPSHPSSDVRSTYKKYITSPLHGGTKQKEEIALAPLCLYPL